MGFLLGAVTSYCVVRRTGAMAEGRWLSRANGETSNGRKRASPRPRPSPSQKPTSIPDDVDSEAGRRTIPTPSIHDVEILRGHGLSMPLSGVKPAELRDTFAEERGSLRRHEAIDIFAPRGTPVSAIDDGRVVKLFNSKPGGLTVYQFDPTETYCYYYAHLERYASGLKEGAVIRRGNLVGYVGTTGNAPTGSPHLHFAIFKLGPEKQWWRGAPLNPYPVLAGAK